MLKIIKSFKLLKAFPWIEMIALSSKLISSKF